MERINADSCPSISLGTISLHVPSSLSSVASYICLTDAAGDMNDAALTLLCLPALLSHMRYESFYIYTLLSS
jgi:hypothetical protein